MTGNELRAKRDASGLSRKALAALAGLHPDSVKYWEGKSCVDLRGHAPERILKALGLGHLSLKGVSPGPSRGGIFWTTTRARDGVLDETDIFPATTRGTKRCGARTRKGKPCGARAIPGKRRCKFHGGASTGPQTTEGKARIAEAQRRRWTAWRADKATV